MSVHKVRVIRRGGGHLAQCVAGGCPAVTGVWDTNAEARQSLALQAHEEAPGAAPTAAEGEESDTNHQESSESMNTVPAKPQFVIQYKHLELMMLALAALADVELADVEGEGDNAPGDYNVSLFLTVRRDPEVTHVVRVAGSNVEVDLVAAPYALSRVEADHYAVECAHVTQVAHSVAEASLADIYAAVTLAGMLRGGTLLEVIAE